MTAAVLRSSPNLAVPHTQNTAPVHEFNCLYTHDLRRKQKRWQDGFLRYHTFNKRVMVYDVPRNFLGDLHWTNGDDLQEGDEMTLEKGGIMVQVSDRIGTIQTDLSELLQRKDRTPAKKPALAPASASRHPTPHSLTPSFTPRTPQGIAQTPMKHKSLNALLGRSRRPIGKASVPTESPFEIRNKELLQSGSDGREAKRQKTSAAIKTPKSASVRAVQRQANSGTCEVIDISSDTEDPLAAQAANRAIDAELLATSSPAPFDSPAHAQKRPVQRHLESTNQAAVESPSARVSSRGGNAAIPKPAVVRTANEPSVMTNPTKKKAAEPPVAGPESKRSEISVTETASGKALRLIGGAPRKMLLFQSQSSRPASSVSEPVERLHARNESANIVDRGVDVPTIRKPEDSTFKQRIEERLARIERKNQTARLQRTSSDTTELRPNVEPTTESSRAGLKKTNSVTIPQRASPVVIPQEDVDMLFDLDPLDFDDDPINDAPISKTLPPPPLPVTRIITNNRSLFKPNTVTERTITARSFKPPAPTKVKATPITATKAAAAVAVAAHPPTAKAMPNEALQAMIAAEKKKNEDVGPWSKEAFDLMDWRPPSLLL